MARSPLDRDDLEGLLRDLMTRLERQERHTHNFPRPAPPGPAPAPPYIPPPVDCTEVIWCDEFDRADGAIGSDWQPLLDLRAPAFATAVMPTLAGGAAVGVANDAVTGAGVNPTARATAVPGDLQFVEAVVTNMWQKSSAGLVLGRTDAQFRGSVFLATHVDPATNICRFVRLAWEGSDGTSTGPQRLVVELWAFTGEFAFGTMLTSVTPFGDPMTLPGSGDYTCRAEISTAGHYRVLLNGDVVIEYDDTVNTIPDGGHQGIEIWWDSQWQDPNLGDITSPRVASVCGGSLCPPAMRRRTMRIPRPARRR